MKKIVWLFSAMLALLHVSSCNNGSSTANEDQWAEMVESKTILIKPEGWDDEYWNEVNKNVDRNKIFNTLLNEVLEGRLKAFNILTDEPFSIEDVKEIIENNQIVASGEAPSQRITENDLSTLRMREQWTFNKEQLSLNKKVSRIDLLLKKLNFDGEYIGDKALFYVYLNN